MSEANSLVASIDMGTNTFHLLIVKIPQSSTQAFEVIHKEKVFVTIGKDGINDGIITEDAQKRMYDALAHFRNVLQTFEVSRARTYVTATSAVRSANNQKEILTNIRERFDLAVNVISGQTEALYIYHGVKRAISLTRDHCLIMDIGGGSVEFVIANEQEVFWKESFEIGAQRLYDRYMTQEPIMPSEVDNLIQHATQMLQPLFDAIRQYAPSYMIGSSGTFDTLYQVNQHKTQKVETTVRSFSSAEFEEIYQLFLVKNKKERLEMPGMSPFRVDMIIVASILVKVVLQHADIGKIIRSPYSLKEGVINFHLS